MVKDEPSAQSKRKEKARLAARARRSQEAKIMLEMAEELEISQDKMKRFDKATIIKLAIDYIKSFEILRPMMVSSKAVSERAETARRVAQATPRLSTSSIFAPKTQDIDSHFLVIKERNGQAAFVLKPLDEIFSADHDLTHLAPQAGDMSIPLEVEPLEGIELDTGLFGCSPSSSKKCQQMLKPLINMTDTNSCSSSSSMLLRTTNNN